MSGSAAEDERVTALALAAGAGEARALERFVRATQRDVWRFLAHLTDPAAADDLAQETYLRALRALPSFAGNGSARAWLLSIARRVVVDQVRAARSRPRIAASVDWLRAAESEPRGSAAGFEDVVEVTALLAGLSQQRREAIVLTQLLGLSYAEAAQVCGCPVGTVRSRVARAREDLLDADEDRRTGEG